MERAQRPSHLMIIPNTKHHPNNTKTDQYFEVIAGLLRPCYSTIPRPSHLMIIPNTKHHPNNTKTDQLLILRYLPAFQGHTITLAHPDETHVQKYGKFGESPVPLRT